MPARLRRSLLALAAAFASAVALSAVACSSDDNDAPSGLSVFDPQGPSAAGSGGSAGSSGVAGTGGVAGASGAAGTPSGSGGAGGVAPECLDPSGCFSATCAPQTTDQFLNRCTDAQCADFDNAARLPLFNGGNLPPLP